MIRRLRFLPLLIVGLLLLGACTRGADAPASPATAADIAATTTDSEAGQLPSTTVAATSTATPTPTPPPTPTPSPTPEPLAALVNGAPITEATYYAHLALFERLDVPLQPGQSLRVWVMDYLIEQALIAQAAAERGVILEEAQVDAALAETTAEIGGEAALNDWLAANGFADETDFRTVVRAELQAQLLLEAFAADLPRAVPMVRARALRLADRAAAETALAELRAGAEYATIFDLYSVDAGDPNLGDLGYFEQDTLLLPALDSAAWSLEEGAYSDVVETAWFDGTPTYFIVQTVRRDAARPIDGNRRAEMAQAAFDAWLADTLAAATIDVMIGFD